MSLRMNITFCVSVLYAVYNIRRKIIFEEVELKHVHIHTLSLSDKIFFNEALSNRSIKVYKRGMFYQAHLTITYYSLI